MFRPIAAIFRLLQFCSKSIIYICLYCEVMLRSHHRYALQSIYLVGSCGFVTDIYLTISLLMGCLKKNKKN